MKCSMALGALAIVAAFAGSLSGCTTRASGTVFDGRTHRPVPGAVLTVGHPGGVGVFEKKVCDAQGRFDFYMFGPDENHLYVYDGQDPTGARRIDRAEIRENMRVYITPTPE